MEISEFLFYLAVSAAGAGLVSILFGLLEHLYYYLKHKKDKQDFDDSHK